MKLSKKSTMVWRSAVCSAAVWIAACSNDGGTANTDNPIETAGVGEKMLD